MSRYPYTDCRDLRHAWTRISDEVVVETNGTVRVFSRVLECARCSTRRVDTYQVNTHGPHTMTRLGSRYQYVAGYHVPGGLNLERLRWELFVNAPRLEAV